MNDPRYTSSVVAIFKDAATAEHARDTLIQNGFRSEQLELTAAGQIARDAATGNTGLTGHHHDSSGGGIGGFFARLFGSESETQDRDYYSRAMQGGRSALVVHANDEAIDRAADILNDQGAISI